MKKTYKIWEVMKMLTENPKLKFTVNSGLEYTMGVDGGYFYFKVFGYNGEYVNPDKYAGGRFNGNIEINSVWTLIQEPVPFVEAVRAYKEGKTIWNEATEYGKRIYKFLPDTDKLYNDRVKAISATEILEGRWYIEE